MFGLFKEAAMVTPERALPGRDAALTGVPETHHVNGNRIQPPFPEHLRVADFGLGCFWGAERMFWTVPGVYSTAVGYQGGFTKNPTYQEVCSGKTGHNEVVRVWFDPSVVTYAQLVAVFFESHDPTQGMRQGNDRGTQYRSGVYVHSDAQRKVAEEAKRVFGGLLAAKGFGAVTTEVLDAPDFYYAEDYHQQYLAKNPGGYCGLGGTGVSCPIGVLENG